MTLLSCQVYDRWVDKVYEVKAGENIDWDGSFRGQDIVTGVYVYSIEWIDSSGQNHVRRGDVTVIR